jgi:hypothetical protein
MLSGGFEIWGYDVSLSYLDDNISDAASTVYDNVLEPVGSAAVWVWEAERDFYGDVPNHPENIIAAIPGVNLLSLAGLISCGTASSKPESKDLPVEIPIDDFEAINYRPILSGRNFDALYNQGIDDYADKNLGTCVMNMDQSAFDFWCYGIKNGRLFDDDDWFSDDDGVCSAWRVYNPQNRQPVCGNSIFHTDDWWNWSDGAAGATDLDDDYDDIFYVLKRMEERNAGGIPGLAWWDADLVEAVKCFADTVEVTRQNQKVQEEFLKLFKIIFTKDYSNLTPEQRAGFVSTETLDNKDLIEQQIYFFLAAVGTNKHPDGLRFETEWKELEKLSNSNDWVTPLIHAGTIYQHMVAVYERHFKEIDEMTEKGIWEIIDDDGALLLSQKDKINPLTHRPFGMDVNQYINEYIWRTPGRENEMETIRTELLREINAAVVLSKERCYNCHEEYFWARELLKYIGYMNDGIVYEIPRLSPFMETLRSRAHRRTQTADECCHLNPPSFLVESTGLCSTQTNAYEHCYAMQPPRMFDETNCACTQEAGAVICMNLLPHGTRVFVFNQEMRMSECVPCEEPTPITRDGITCVARRRRTARRETQSNENSGLRCRPPNALEIAQGVRTQICQ